MRWNFELSVVIQNADLHLRCVVSILCCVYYLHQKGRKMLLLDIKEQLFPRGGGGGQFSIICNPFQDLIVSKMCSIFQHCFLMRIYIQDSPPPPPLWIFPSSKWCTCCSKIPNLIKRDYFYLKCSKSRTNRKSGISQYYLPDSTKTMHDNELLRTDRIFNNMYNNKSYLKISLVLRVATCGEFNEKNVQLICTLYT